ncbi:MAG: hypothetical protein U1A78_23920 [Polyangia bacterium]
METKDRQGGPDRAVQTEGPARRPRTRQARLGPWLLLVVLAALGPGRAAAEEAWQACKVKDAGKDDLSLEKRAVPDSKFHEYRAQVTSKLSAEAILRTLWGNLTDPPQGVVKQRQILRKSATEVVLYDQVRTPVVSDRDYTLRIWLEREPAGTVHLKMHTAPELGPPPADKHVRIPIIRGEWTLVPRPEGGARVTFQCFSEPGGSVPAFMVRGAQQDQVVSDVRRILAKAEAQAAAGR